MINTNLDILNPVIDRVERAKELHVRTIETLESMAQPWFVIADSLGWIEREQLWRELGYHSWANYVSFLKIKLQTVMNYIVPFNRLLDSGHNPEVFKELPLSRVSALASIAKVNNGVIEPELIELAKQTGTRKKAQAFNEAVKKAKHESGLEEFRTIKVVVPQSLYDLWHELCQAKAGEKEITNADMLHVLEISLVAGASEINNE